MARNRHADVARRSVHMAVAWHIQWMEPHQVLLTVANPITHVDGDVTSMPHVRPYALTRAQCRKAASVASAADDRTSRAADGSRAADEGCEIGSANVTVRRVLLRAGSGTGDGDG